MGSARVLYFPGADAPSQILLKPAELEEWFTRCDPTNDSYIDWSDDGDIIRMGDYLIDIEGIMTSEEYKLLDINKTFSTYIGCTPYDLSRIDPVMSCDKNSQWRGRCYIVRLSGSSNVKLVDFDDKDFKDSLSKLLLFKPDQNSKKDTFFQQMITLMVKKWGEIKKDSDCDDIDQIKSNNPDEKNSVYHSESSNMSDNDKKEFIYNAIMKAVWQNKKLAKSSKKSKESKNSKTSKVQRRFRRRKK